MIEPKFIKQNPDKHIYSSRVINGVKQQLIRNYGIKNDFLDISKMTINDYVIPRQVFFYRLIQKGFTPTYIEYKIGINKNTILKAVQTAKNRLQFDKKFIAVYGRYLGKN